MAGQVANAIEVENRGGTTSFSIVMAQSLPTGLQAVNWTCVASAGASCPAALGQAMTLASMPRGGILVFGCAVALRLTLAGSEVSARFEATAEGVPLSDDNVDEATVSVRQPQADLQVRQSVLAQVAAGVPVQFSVNVTNLGPDAARGATLAHALSGGFVAGSGRYSCSASGGAACPANPGSTQALADMPVGSTLRLIVEATAGAADGTVTGLATVTVAGDPQAANNSDSDTVAVVLPPARLSVSMSAPATAPVGGSAAFSARVINGGPDTATGVVLDFAASGVTGTPAVSCTASAGAVCPESLGANTLRLVYGQATDGLVIGSTQTATVAVRYAGDPDVGNDEADASTVITGPADARNGDYRLYGAEGRQRTLRLDFDRREMTIDGNVISFDSPDADGVHGAGGGRRFRILDGLVVGLDNSSGTLQPYVAARSFVTDLKLLGDGTDIVLVGRSLEPGGPGSRYAGARWSNDTLQICGASTPLRIASCPAGSITTYRLALRTNGDIIDATDTAAGSAQALSFRIARVGSELVLLRAGASVDGISSLMQIGLAAAATAGSSFIGGTTTGDWGTSTLTPTQLVFDGASDDLIALTADTTGWPQGLQGGARVSDGASALVIGSPHLLVTVVARSAPAAGVVSIGLAR